ERLTVLVTPCPGSICTVKTLVISSGGLTSLILWCPAASGRPICGVLPTRLPSTNTCAHGQLFTRNVPIARGAGAAGSTRAACFSGFGAGVATCFTGAGFGARRGCVCFGDAGFGAVTFGACFGSATLGAIGVAAGGGAAGSGFA